MPGYKQRLNNYSTLQKNIILAVGVVVLLALFFSLLRFAARGMPALAANWPSPAKAPTTDVTINVNTSSVTEVNNLAPGATFTQDSDALFTNEGQHLLQTSLGALNVQIMGWGADNPEPSPGQYDWETLDQRVQLMRTTGATKIITFCCAPDWMKGGTAGKTDWSKLETAPLSSHFDDFAQLAAQVALRYHDVQYFQVWNELKGFYNDQENRWDYESYTALYNKVYDAVKAVRPDAKLGGPYVVVGSYSHYSTTKPKENRLDQKALDVISYWLAHKHGADFIALDGGPGPKDHVTSSGVKDEFAAGQFFNDVSNWVYKQPGAGHLPISWAEWYPGSERNWHDANHFNAIIANDLIYTLKNGAIFALLWGIQGNSKGIALPEGLMTSDAKATPFYTTAKAFKDYFAPGTKLCAITISDPASIAAIASASHALLVNKTDKQLITTVNGKRTTLTPYQVSVVEL